MEKGELIEVEKEKQYKSQKSSSKILFIVCVFFIIIFIALIVMDFITESFDDDSLMMLGPIIIILLAGIFLGYIPNQTRTQIQIFENGFIPNKRSLSDARNNKELFIPWNKVTGLNISFAPHNPKMWLYTIHLKNNKPNHLVIASVYFENSDKVLNKMKEVEKTLNLTAEEYVIPLG